MGADAKAGLACVVMVAVVLAMGAVQEFQKLEHRLRVLAYSVWGLNFEEAYETEFDKQLRDELEKNRPTQ